MSLLDSHHSAILKGKEIDPVASRIGCQKILSGRVECNRMWMGRCLIDRVSAGTDLFQNLRHSLDSSVGANREHVVGTSTVNRYDEIVAIGRDGGMPRLDAGERQWLSIHQSKAAVMSIDPVRFDGPARQSFIFIDFVYHI